MVAMHVSLDTECCIVPSALLLDFSEILFFGMKTVDIQPFLVMLYG
jgi:hypothetical protein